MLLATFVPFFALCALGSEKAAKRPEKSLSPAKNAKKFGRGLEEKRTSYTAFRATVSPGR
jgi:hypothetical protein